MTLQEKIAELKTQFPTIKVGSDEDNGYTDLEPLEYEATISSWADNLLAAELEAAKVPTPAEKLFNATGLTVAEYKALGL